MTPRLVALGIRPRPSTRDLRTAAVAAAFWSKFERSTHVHDFGATSIPATYACTSPGCGSTVRRIPG